MVQLFYHYTTHHCVVKSTCTHSASICQLERGSFRRVADGLLGREGPSGGPAMALGAGMIKRAGAVRGMQRLGGYGRWWTHGAAAGGCSCCLLQRTALPHVFGSVSRSGPRSHVPSCPRLARGRAEGEQSGVCHGGMAFG